MGRIQTVFAFIVLVKLILNQIERSDAHYKMQFEINSPNYRVKQKYKWEL
jgi:hypothetical protein